MPKKNGFCFYMEERKPGILAAGHELPRGKHDLAELVSDDWKALSEQERARYNERAKQFNERAGNKTQSKPVQNPVCRKKALALEENWNELSERDIQTMMEARSIVSKMFTTPNWMDQPIVICTFSVYFQPEYYDSFIPAEVGLSVMSVTKGLTDNYARIIDLGTIPKGHALDVAQAVKRLGIPEPGTSRSFTDYENLMFSIESFLDMYKGNLNDDSGDLYIFAFDSDYVIVTRCLEWLMEKIKNQFSVKVLSLDYYTFLGSTQKTALATKNKAKSKTRGSKELGPANPPQQSIITPVSSYRSVGTPLTENFVYSEDYPMTRFGLFLMETEVDSVIKQVDNYKYEEGLCCVYHGKSGTETQNCALTTTNRYAFSILEFLTLTNNVPIIPGSHFPEIHDPLIEKRRRYQWLRSWGLTSFEVEMKEYCLQEDQARDREVKVKEWKGENRHGPTGNVQKEQPRKEKKERVKKTRKPPSTTGEGKSTTVGMQSKMGDTRQPKKQQEPVYTYDTEHESDETGQGNPFSGAVPLFFRSGFSSFK